MSDTEDVGRQMHAAALAHMQLVQFAVDHYDECPDPDCNHVDDPSLSPYCGCEVCIVREVLAGAWPVIEQLLLSSSSRSDDAQT